jgi:hypothetical protein
MTAGLLLQPADAADAAVFMLLSQLAAARLQDGSSIEEGCALLAGQVRENIALRRGYLVRAGPNGEHEWMQFVGFMFSSRDSVLG